MFEEKPRALLKLRAQCQAVSKGNTLAQFRQRLLQGDGGGGSWKPESLKMTSSMVLFWAEVELSSTEILEKT